MHRTVQRNRLGQALSAGLPEFETLFGQFFRPEESTTWRAPASIWEAENVFHIEVDAPGVAKECRLNVRQRRAPDFARAKSA